MPNQFVVRRLEALLRGLQNTHLGTLDSASAVKGAVRAEFIAKFLAQVIPQGLRIAQSGEITNAAGNKTGEVDVIIENGFSPSLPNVGTESGRLYFAEGVACVIEVKSDLRGQWDEAAKTAAALGQVSREIQGGEFGGNITVVPGVISNSNAPKLITPPIFELKRKVPYFVAGYRGWKSTDELKKRLVESETISGVLQIDSGYFCTNKMFGNLEATGSLSLLAFLAVIHRSASYIQNPQFNLISYGV